MVTSQQAGPCTQLVRQAECGDLLSVAVLFAFPLAAIGTGLIDPPSQVWDDVPPKLKVGKCPCAVTWGFPPEKKYGVPQ